VQFVNVGWNHSDREGLQIMYEAIVDKYLGLMEFDGEKSKLSIAGTAVSFHCDKFNTRILKNFEDVMGYSRAGEMLAKMAQKTTYDAMKYVLNETDAGANIKALGEKEQLEAFLEILSALAYGSIKLVEYGDNLITFQSEHSYLAEGWLENKKRWKLDEREGPACHDIRGHLSAIIALIKGKPFDAYTVQEITCRAHQDAANCKFIAEVN